MAPHSSTLAWKIPWTGEPGGLQSMGSLRVRHDWATSLSLFTFMHWRCNGNPLQCSCLENSRDGGAWWAAVYGVAQSRTRLKWLSNRTLIFTIQRNFLMVKKYLLCISFLSLFFPYIFFLFINCSPTILKIYPILSDFLCNYVTFIIMLKFHWGIIP